MLKKFKPVAFQLGNYPVASQMIIFRTETLLPHIEAAWEENYFLEKLRSSIRRKFLSFSDSSTSYWDQNSG